MNLCLCGCGNSTTVHRGKSKKYFHGHNRMGKKQSELARDKISFAHTGRPLSEEHKLKLSLSHKGRPSPKRGITLTEEQRNKISISKTGKRLNQNHRLKISHSLVGRPKTEKHRKAMGQSRNGSNCHFWKGGISSENEKLRKSLSFKLWREAIFIRDDFTCQQCKTKGGNLHPHHIKSFSLYPELRFVVDNGETLCMECHRNTNNYGNRGSPDRPHFEVKE